MGFWGRMGVGTSSIGFVRSCSTPFFGLLSLFFAAIAFPAKSPDKRSPCDAALIVEDATRRDAVVQVEACSIFWPMRATLYVGPYPNAIYI